jgi:hypothetical protein
LKYNFLFIINLKIELSGLICYIWVASN